MKSNDHVLTAGILALALMGMSASNAVGQSVVATIPIPTTGGLSRPALDPARHRLYVVAGAAFYPSTLFVVDTDTNTVIRTIGFTVFAGEPTYNPANNKLYVGAQVSGHVKVIDLDTFSETPVSVPGCPTGIDVNPITNKVYVTSQCWALNDKLFVIDGATNAVAGPFDLNGVAGGVVVNPATNRVYSAAGTTCSPNNIKTRVFNGANNSVVTDLPLVVQLGVDSVRNRVYVGVQNSSSCTAAGVRVLDGNTHSEIATLPASLYGNVAVNPDLNRLYVALSELNQIAVVDTTTHTLVGTVSDSGGPSVLSVDRSTGRIYVSNSREPTISVLGSGCTYSIAPASQSFTATAATGSVAVTAGTGCTWPATWTATSNASWITITSGSSGSGNGTVAFSVAANTSTGSRTGTLTIAGQTFTVNQSAAACSYAIAPTTVVALAGGRTGSVTVTAPAGCAWTATSNASWITITSGASGSGNGTVDYSVAANTMTSLRSGTLTIAGQTFTVDQVGATCSYAIAPASASVLASGTTGSVTVTAPTGCTWTASSSTSWITITSGSSGNGNGRVDYTVAANTTTSARSGTLTIAGQTFTLTQAGVTGGAQNVITTVAGNGTAGFSGDGGPATSASLETPIGIAVDVAGNLYIADTANNRVRKVSPGGIITRVAGSGVRGFSGDGGLATSASLWNPSGLAVDAAGNLYIADASNNRIRKVSPSGIITTVAGGGTGYFSDGGPATSGSLVFVQGVAVDPAGNLYIADRYTMCIRKVSPSGTISTVAGNGLWAFSGDGGPATSASLSWPDGVALDVAGNLYIADTANNRVRKVSPAGIITTVAGNGTGGFSGDGGPATSASLYSPYGMALDGAGNLYIADTGNNRIRKVSPSGTISTVAGSGISGFSADGEPATSALLNRPHGVALDTAGNLYIADTGNNRIRKVWAAAPSFTASPASLSFSTAAGSAASAPQQVTLSSTIPGLAWQATMGTSSGGNWLSVSPASGQIPATISVSVDASNLAAGSYQGSFTISVPVASPSVVTIAVTFTVTQAGTGGVKLTINQTDGSQCPQMRLFASVTDSQGQPIMNLGASNFTLVEDGQARSITVAAGASGQYVIGYTTGSSAAAHQVMLTVNHTGQSDRKTTTVVPCCDTREPLLDTTLQPGFYIAEATGTTEGYWGMEALAQRGDLSGGFNLGGGLQEKGTTVGFGGFYLRDTQSVSIRATAQVVPGGDASSFSMCVRLLDSKRQVIGTDQCGTTVVEFQRTLSSGFYVVEVRSGGSSPRATFQLGLAANYFSGGVDVGGFVAPGLTGFGAFFLPADRGAQEVSIKVLGRPSYGSVGACNLQLRLLDGNRNVLQVVGRPPSASVSISPRTAVVVTGQTQQFTATVSGTTDTAVTWSVNNIAGGNATVGTISTTGLYTAPGTAPRPNTVTVKAASVSDPIGFAAATVTIGAVPSPPITLSANSGSPGQTLTISGAAFDPAASTSVVFTDSSGHQLVIPAATVTSTSLTAILPYFVDFSTGRVAPATVSVSVLQQSSSRSAGFGPATGFQVGDLPSITDPPGTLTLAFLDQLQTLLTTALGDQANIQTVSNGTVDTSRLRTDLAGIQAQLATLRSGIQSLASGTVSRIDLGTISGQPVVLDATSLGVLDQLLTAYFLGPPTAASVGGAAVLSAFRRPGPSLASVGSFFGQIACSADPTTVFAAANKVGNVFSVGAEAVTVIGTVMGTVYGTAVQIS
jgi:DNA-binding beta-propeller fold protein YncE